MLHRGTIAAALVALALLGCKKKSVGEECSKDGDCSSGVCLDLSEADDGCSGHVCTQPCKKNGDCPAVAEGRDCDPVKGRSLCLYGEWEKQYCKKNKKK